MLLEVRDLTISYGKNLPAVERVSLQLEAGESLGLIGESGSGKSTLGRSLINLLPNNTQIHGSVNIQEQSVLDLSVGQLQHWRGEKVALIFQDPMTRLNPLMTIAEHGLEMLRSHLPKLSRKQAKQKLSDTLKSVRIDADRANQYPHEFSGGMRQRVMIALSLLLEPSLIIADEPTTSLDVTVAAEILQELTILRHRHGMGLLLITHDLGLVAQYCDRIAVMYEGVIVETGSAQQIFHQPQHPYTQNLLRSVIHFKTPTPEVDIPILVAEEIPDILIQPLDVDEQLEAPILDTTNLQPLAANNIQESKILAPDPEPITKPFKPLLKVRNLTKHYLSGSNFVARWFDRSAGLVKAIDGVDLEVFPGEIMGLIGESGSGKSSTGKAILQLIKPDSGSVVFNSIELTQLPAEQMRKLRAQMQMIFQDPRACLNPQMTVFRSVADPLLIHKLVPDLTSAKPRVLEILDQVGIPPSFAERLPSDLSGGQLQRVAIARALITNPQFLICDEPVSMLDATIQSQILQLMLDLKQAYNLTYLFITHDLAVAQFFCTQMAVMRQGKIVERGTNSSVLSHPQHFYTQTLLKSVPRFH